MSTLTQRSFAGGEIAPNLYARVDFNRFQTSLRTCRNFIVQKHGGAANRPGTQFVNLALNTLSSTAKTRLIPFSAGLGSNYVLEFCTNKIRFIKDDAYILQTGFNIITITNAAAGIVTTPAPHGYNVGDPVILKNIVGPMAEHLNNRYTFANPINATQFYLYNLNGTLVNTTSFGV